MNEDQQGGAAHSNKDTLQQATAELSAFIYPVSTTNQRHHADSDTPDLNSSAAAAQQNSITTSRIYDTDSCPSSLTTITTASTPMLMPNATQLPPLHMSMESGSTSSSPLGFPKESSSIAQREELITSLSNTLSAKTNFESPPAVVPPTPNSATTAAVPAGRSTLVPPPPPPAVVPPAPNSATTAAVPAGRSTLVPPPPPPAVVPPAPNSGMSEIGSVRQEKHANDTPQFEQFQLNRVTGSGFSFCEMPKAGSTDSERFPERALMHDTLKAGGLVTEINGIKSSLQIGDLKSSLSVFHRFTPVIPQGNYLESDIRKIQKSSKFVLRIGKNFFARVKHIPMKTLKLMEPKDEWISSFRSYGLAYRQYEEDSAESSFSWGVSLKDFVEAPFAFESILIAISVSLWGTVLYQNDLLNALIADSAFPSRREEDERSRSCDYVVSVMALFHWLSQRGIDIIVTTPGRSAGFFMGATSSNTSGSSLTIEGAKKAVFKESGNNDGDVSLTSKGFISNFDRVLVALVYDAENDLWSPASTARPIRHAAEKRKEWVMAQRKVMLKEKRKRLKKMKVERKNHRLKKRRVRWEQMCEDEAVKSKRYLESKSDMLFHKLSKAQDSTQAPWSSLAIRKSLGGDKEDITACEGPFREMMYPNLQQTDFGFFRILGKVRHPWFSRGCIRLLLGGACGALCVATAIALLILLGKSMHWCVQSQESENSSLCLPSKAEDANAAHFNSSAFPPCLEELYTASFSERIVYGFLFGSTAGLGRLLIGAIFTSFFGIISGSLTVFFAVRSYAVGSTNRKFLYLYHAINLSLGAFTVGLVTWISYLVINQKVKGKTVFSCSSLSKWEESQCLALQDGCPAYMYVTFFVLQSGIIQIVLSGVMLLCSVVHLIVFCLPLIPSHSTQIRTAIPDTYAFRPSPFSPDGLSINQQSDLRDSLYPSLHQNLVLQNNELNRLVSKSKTVKEIMHASEQQKHSFWSYSDRRFSRKHGETRSWHRRRKTVTSRYHRSAPPHRFAALGNVCARPYLGTQLQIQVETIASELLRRESPP